MNLRPLLILAVLFLASSAGEAVDIKNRSNTASGQFTIYCDDRALRGELADLAEETKASVLKVLNRTDAWEIPVVITVSDDSPHAGQRVNLKTGYGSTKIDLVLSSDRRALQKNGRRRIIDATLLDLALRGNASPKAGESFHYPPRWLVDGIDEVMLRGEGGASDAVLKNILNAAKVPSLEKILADPAVEISESVNVINRASAMCLVATLLAQENGPQALTRFLKSWILHGGDPLQKLTAEFPSLGESGKNLGKWWSLQLARFASGDHIQSLSADDTDRELSKVLSLDVIVDKKGNYESFMLSDFETYLRFAGSAVALRTGQVRLAALGAKAHPAFRPILNGYSRVFGLLIAKKTKGLSREFFEIETYRQTLRARINDVADYLNWYEATQTGESSGTFEKYLNVTLTPATREIRGKPDKRVCDYLDTLERDFAARN